MRGKGLGENVMKECKELVSQDNRTVMLLQRTLFTCSDFN